MSELLLGVDMGTSSTKAVLVTPEGDVVATAVRTHSMSVPKPGWAEVDPETVWWGDLMGACQELLAQVGDHHLAGMCVSGVGPCLLICDSDTRPVRDAILYGIDMRATTEIEALTEQFGADAIVQRCGNALSSQSVGPKMRWVRDHEPDAWRAGRRWYNSNSFVIARLTGAYVLDHHSASQSDPLYDLQERGWADDWYAEVAQHLERPALAWPHEVVGEVSAQAAEQTGLPAGLPVCIGTIDAWSEAYSAGVRQPGDLMLMYGTTMFFVQVLQDYHAHPMLWTTNGAEPGQYTLAAGMATSGSLTGWVQRLTGGADFATLVQEAAGIPAGSEGLLTLPYFAGERTPVFDPQARGVLLGLTLQHERGHLFRSVYEGIAFGIRQIVEFLDSDDEPVRRLVAVGGGTQGGLWTQIVSDVTGRAQVVPEQAIGASYGDALLAAVGVGLVEPGTDWTKVGVQVQPDPDVREVYDQMYRSYERLYPATREEQHAMAALQRFAP